MKKIFLSGLIIFISLNYVVGQAVKFDSLTVVPFGKVYTYIPATVLPQNLIIMISGDGGWKYGVTDFSREFSQMNSVVVGVDILRYYKHLRQMKTECYMVSADFVELATAIERKYNFTGYVPPVVMGYSSGATLVYGILAQARAGTFMGGISLGFCPDIELPKTLCQVNGLTEKELVQGKSFLFLPDARLGNQWIVLQGKEDKICDFQTVSDFVGKTTDASLIVLPNVGHGFSKWSDFMPQWKAAYTEMIKKFRSDQPLNNQVPLIAKIPTIITRGKSTQSSKIIAILFSGDGGWYSLEQSIANHLSDWGISTLGIDTRKYFWNRKSPETTASDIASLLSYYGKEWNISQFMLMGYSQGAEIIPFVLNRLPEELKSRVISSVMLSPEITTDFEVHVTNMLGIGNRQNTYNVIEEIIGIQKTRQICIYGEKEKTDVPELLKDTKVETVFIPGDHHYKSNSALIVQVMKNKNAF